jgi:hypothetical protein
MFRWAAQHVVQLKMRRATLLKALELLTLQYIVFRAIKGKKRDLSSVLVKPCGSLG